MNQKLTAGTREEKSEAAALKLRDTLVLLVEDDEAIASGIEALLGPEVFALQIAESLEEARRMIACSLPNIIVLDRGLPDGEGAALCAELRRGPRTRRIPILFLSARNELGDRIFSLKAGADDYLAKPFHPVELLARLKALRWRIDRFQ